MFYIHNTNGKILSRLKYPPHFVSYKMVLVLFLSFSGVYIKIHNIHGKLKRGLTVV